jgi:hypothetical protein
MSDDPGASLLRKLHRFAEADLDPTERVLLGVLLAPGVSALLQPSDVEGFDMGVGTSDAIRALEDALLDSTLRIVTALDDHEVADWLAPDLDDPA